MLVARQTRRGGLELKQPVRANARRVCLWLVLIAAAPVLCGDAVHAQSADKQAPPKHTPAPPKAAAKPPAGPTPAHIDRNGVVIMIRSVLLALDQANKTGNYTVLRDLGAPGFQVNTAAKLAEIFASQRAQGMDLGGVAVLEPQLTLLPQIEPNGMLHMAGFFPSTPLQVKFELLFAPVDRQWKIFGLSVNVAASAPQAPPSPQTDAAPKHEPPPQAPTGAVDVRKSDKGAAK